jgi:glycosyltransferase involved in cell wall biosynthesis
VTAPAEALWRHAPEPAAGLCASVVVPVRNEAAGLPRTLCALAAQAATFRRSYEVLLLANNCDDGTAQVARQFARSHPRLPLFVAEVTLPDTLAHVGHARRLLMDEASRRLAASRSAHTVIASTDGDTVVAPGWLANTLAEIEAGADAVGGRILTAAHAATDARTARRQRCDTAYRLARERLESLLDPDPFDPWPRHHQHFCASLAVSRAAYERVGGVPAVRWLEDEALVAALRQHDLRVRHSPHVRVLTSGRHHGRVEVGLSWQLREWARSSSEASALMVEDAHDLLQQVAARRQLRGLWKRKERDAARIGTLARGWGLPAGWLAERLQCAPAFGALWAEVQVQRQRTPRAPVPVRQAIGELRGLIASLLEREKTSSR